MAWRVQFGGGMNNYGMPMQPSYTINPAMPGYEVMPQPTPWTQPTGGGINTTAATQAQGGPQGNIWQAIAQAIAQVQQARAASRPSLQSLGRMDYIRGGGDPASGVGFSDALRQDADRIYERSRRNAVPNIWDQILSAAGPAAGIYGAGQQSGWRWR